MTAPGVNTMANTYLFKALFTDGTSIQQTPEDISSITEGKNCFYDVLQRLDDVEVFALHSDCTSVVVDITTGTFAINGVEFNAIGSDEFPHDAKRRLIYFRRHQHTFEQGEELSHETEYHIGFQTTVDGKNIQQTIAVR